MRVTALICLLCAGWWLRAFAADSRGLSLRVETYHVVTERTRPETNPNAITGEVSMEPSGRLVGPATEVPLILKHGFLVVFYFEGEFRSLSEVQLIVRYPPMQSPRGEFPGIKERKQSVYDIGPDRITEFAYFFDEPWELVEGDWEIEIWNVGRRIGYATIKAKKTEAEPGATDNPDDAQRLREVH